MSFKRFQRLMIALMLGWLGCAVQGQRLAAQKCAEYQDVSFNRKYVIPLVIDPRLIEFPVVNCTSAVKLIVGGEQAKPGEFPHHALLGFRKKGGKSYEYDFKCGGTLISQRHVLTAAHCFVDDDPVIVRLGEYNTSTIFDGQHDSDIERILRHPNHTFYGSYHDIALIKLEHPIIFSSHIRPACLCESEEMLQNTAHYIATGFGYNDMFGSESSSVMMKVELDEFPANDCAMFFKNHRLLKHGVQDGQLCVGSFDKGRDTCRGDSGGPLQVVLNSKSCTYAVVGITSAGGVCGIRNSKAIYTKVSHYINWIEDKVWGPNPM